MMNLTEALASLTPLVMLLFTLGAVGWWRLLARDSIFDSARAWWWHRFPYEGYQVAGEANRPKRGRSVWSGGAWYCQKGTKLGELLYCHWCLSFWVGLAQFGAYLLFPQLVLVFAIAHGVRITAALIDSRLG